jgi:hypothetical protein
VLSNGTKNIPSRIIANLKKNYNWASFFNINSSNSKNSIKNDLEVLFQDPNLVDEACQSFLNQINQGRAIASDETD